jgi:hypothetical protein
MPGTDNALQEILDTYYPAFKPCGGQCNYTWNGSQWVPGGDTCTGGCGCPAPPQVLRKLMVMKCGAKVAAAMSVPCAAAPQLSNEPAIAAYVTLLLAYNLLLKVAIGLGLLSLMLAIALVYLRLR